MGRRAEVDRVGLVGGVVVVVASVAGAEVRREAGGEGIDDREDVCTIQWREGVFGVR